MTQSSASSTGAADRSDRSRDSSGQAKAHSSLNHSLAGIASLPTSQTDDAAKALLQLSIALLDSAVDILSEAISDDKQLTHQSVLMPGGTLGKHFRHVRRPLRSLDETWRVLRSVVRALLTNRSSRLTKHSSYRLTCTPLR